MCVRVCVCVCVWKRQSESESESESEREREREREERERAERAEREERNRDRERLACAVNKAVPRVTISTVPFAYTIADGLSFRTSASIYILVTIVFYRSIINQQQ